MENGIFLKKYKEQALSQLKLVFPDKTDEFLLGVIEEQIKDSVKDPKNKFQASMVDPKGVEIESSVEEILDYLESEHLLDDRRFAGAWLRNRFITHSEGRIKLTAELSSRGVKKEAIKAALDDFFCEHTELELCSRAFSKLRRICSNDEKNYASLQRLGFSYKTIQKAVMEKF